MTNPVTLDRYQLLGELGSGSFGVVYLAYDPKLEREVAVKLVKPEIANDADTKLRFRREWKSIGRLRHPNIIELLDYSDGQWMYLVTERLRGKTLLQLTQERPEPLDPVLAAAVIHEVALALEHAHEHGIVHRDVKPENIFLEPSGRIVLCDFGIAFAVRHDEDTTMRGRNTQLLGSPLYMSPEQIASQGVGPPSDLFSLGAVAYFLVCNRDAFHEASVLGVLKRIQAGEHHPFPDAIADSPYVAAAKRLLQPKVADRFPDAAAAADAFLDVVHAAGHGDPRRLLKQQLASFAEQNTTPSGVVKALEDVDGESKTYVTTLSSNDQDTQISIPVSDTAVATGTMRRASSPQSTSVHWAAVAAVVIGVAGAIGVYTVLTAQRQPLPPPIVALSPTPEEPRPPVIPPPELPKPPQIEQPLRLPEPLPDPPPQVPRVGEKKAATPRKDKGKLKVVVVPWGAVFVDGVKMGVTPEVRELELAAGPHMVRIVNPDFVPQERTVTVPANDTVKLRVELQ